MNNNNNNLRQYFVLLIVIMAFIIELSITSYTQTKKSKNSIPQFAEISHDLTTNPVTSNAVNVEKVQNKPSQKNKKLIFEIGYTECSHIKTTEVEILDDLSIEEIEKAYPDAKLKEVLNDKIIFSIIEDGKCDEHYVIKEKDGKVAVFLDKPIKNILLKQVTNIDYSTISNEYKNEIEKGLYIDSNSELEATLNAIQLSSLT